MTYLRVKAGHRLALLQGSQPNCATPGQCKEGVREAFSEAFSNVTGLLDYITLHFTVMSALSEICIASKGEHYSKIKQKQY